MRHHSHAKAGPAISTQSRKERRVHKGATALESRKPTSAKDRLRRFAARSRRHGREQVPATSRSHAAHFVSFAFRTRNVPPARHGNGLRPSRKGSGLISFWFQVSGFGISGLPRSGSPHLLSVIHYLLSAARQRGFRVPREAQIFAAYALLAATHYLKPLYANR